MIFSNSNVLSNSVRLTPRQKRSIPLILAESVVERRAALMEKCGTFDGALIIRIKGRGA